MRGLYVHIPFCARKCAYCDFYSLTVPPETRQSYIEAVLREAEDCKGMPFQTVYLGGGTPSLLGGELLKNLMTGLGAIFDLSSVEEMTIEVNPESATSEFLDGAADAGFTRISIGVQSLNDNELQAAGRIHTASQAIDTVTLAKGKGFRSISADVIIGLPGQTWLSLHQTLERLVFSGIEHLSLYCLMLEEGTPLAENPPRTLPSEDMQAELFQFAGSLLERYGYRHYEISNFAREGYESRHNLVYWHGGEYLGLGPAAASHLNGKRYRNRADLAGYMKQPGGQPEDIEELGPKEKAAEEAMLRLRLLEEGIDTRQLAEKHGQENVREIFERCERMAARGELLFDGLRYRLSPSRVLTSNPVFAELLGLNDTLS